MTVGEPSYPSRSPSGDPEGDAIPRKAESSGRKEVQPRGPCSPLQPRSVRSSSIARRATAHGSTDLPARLFCGQRVNPSPKKYSDFPKTRITAITVAVLLRKRGVGHRHDRWGGM